MSLDSYSGLLSSVAGWLMRDDLTAVIPDFVALAEADMNQKLRLRSMLTRSTTTLDDDTGFETLPTDFLQMYRLTLDDEDLDFAPALQMPGFALDWQGASAPLYYSIVGNQLQFVPAPMSLTGSLDMIYYARVPALSVSNTSNVILAANPAIYLYGALLASAPYLGDDARVQTWGTLYSQALDGLQMADDNAEFAGPLVIRSLAGEMLP
jgi:hypothetical protein